MGSAVRALAVASRSSAMLAAMSSRPADLIVVDTETTGLDPTRDRVIDLGAVRLNEHLQVVDTFESLVDPGRPLPLQITRLTGITDADLATAPSFAAAYAALLEFAAGAPLVGQNVGFDAQMLAAEAARCGAPPPPPVVFDTLAASQLLFAELDRHGLDSLAGALGLDAPPHRALADAQVTAALLRALRRRAADLPADERSLFEAAGWEPLALLDHLAPPPRPGSGGLPPASEWRRERPTAGASADGADDRPEALGCRADAWRGALADGGPLTELLDGYAVRPGQVDLAAASADLLVAGGLGLFEAGTGMGKSLAYLLPAAFHAAARGTRVVVSTKTKALQRQLAERELPLVASCLPTGFRWALLMGRENYLCLRRLYDAIDDAGRGLPEPDRLLALAWLLGRARRGEIDLSALPYGAVMSLPALAETGRELCSTSVSCLGRRCRLRGDCLWRSSRQRAQRAHLVCVNHALLLTGADTLPTFDDLVIDEAHLLPDEAVSAFSERVDARSVGELLLELRGRRGQRPLAAVARTAAGGLPPDAAAALARATDGLESAARDLPVQAADLGQALRGLSTATEGDGDGGPDDDGGSASARRRERATANGRQPDDGYGRILLITPGVQERSAFDGVALACDTLAGGLVALAQAASLAADALPDEHHDKPRLVSTGADAAAAASVVSGASGLLTPDDVYWAELLPDDGGRRDAAGRRAGADGAGWGIEHAPLSPASLIRERLWERLRTAVLLSATLGVAGSFAYYRTEAGLTAGLGVTERVFPSPFDYRRQAALVLEHDPAVPYVPAEQPGRLAARLRRLTEITGGRLLALFTNKRELEQVTSLIGPHVEGDGVVVLAQGIHGSAAALADEFRTHPATVLLGVDTLWTGQDFPGDALVCLVIAKLPFPRQDARFQARRRAAQSEGRDWFHDFYLPEAVLRFRQGFGRLIRTETDVGVVAVLDHRLTQKAYEREFLASLPELEVLRVAPAELPDVVATALEDRGALPDRVR